MRAVQTKIDFTSNQNRLLVRNVQSNTNISVVGNQCTVQARLQYQTPTVFRKNAAKSINRSKLTLICQAAGTAPRVAVEGDLVTIHWDCMNDQGEMLESTRSQGEATTFEVGAGNIVGNRIFEAFDEAVRGLAEGDKVAIKADGGPWNPDLLFNVPRTHQEIERLEGRYKNVGGLKEGLVVELGNGGLAVVTQMNDEAVQLDANSMLAGKKLIFEMELIGIERN